jgi:hypothetical protein
MSLSFEVCISHKFCIQVINFQREDKDQDALLMKEIYHVLLKSRFYHVFHDSAVIMIMFLLRFESLC